MTGFNAAAKLYQAYGFELVEEYYGIQWSSGVVAHKYVRPGRHRESRQIYFLPFNMNR